MDIHTEDRMDSYGKKRKPGKLGASLAASAASAVTASNAAAALKPKAPGETKVVIVTGITGRNNGLAQEMALRKIFTDKKDWRLFGVRAGGLFTPDLIADADLLMISRGAGADPVDLFADNSGIADTITAGSDFWTEKNVNAIIDNVKNRGMGLLALHNSIAAESRAFTDFLDIAPLKANDFEPLWITRINREHPITGGVGKFLISRDEQYLAIIKSRSTATLFESTAVHEKRQGVSGWALERGKGRIAGLLPGSTVHAYQAPEYRNIVWRAAHWAMYRDIPDYPHAQNRYYD